MTLRRCFLTSVLLAINLACVNSALFTSAGFQWGAKTYGAHIVPAGVASFGPA